MADSILCQQGGLQSLSMVVRGELVPSHHPTPQEHYKVTGKVGVVWVWLCGHMNVTCRADVCIKCDALWTLMRSFSDGTSSILSLSPRVQREIMGALVMCAMGTGDRKKEFLTQVAW